MAVEVTLASPPTGLGPLGAQGSGPGRRSLRPPPVSPQSLLGASWGAGHQGHRPSSRLHSCGVRGGALGREELGSWWLGGQDGRPLSSNRPEGPSCAASRPHGPSATPHGSDQPATRVPEKMAHPAPGTKGRQGLGLSTWKEAGTACLRPPFQAAPPPCTSRGRWLLSPCLQGGGALLLRMSESHLHVHRKLGGWNLVRLEGRSLWSQRHCPPAARGQRSHTTEGPLSLAACLSPRKAWGGDGPTPDPHP